MMLSLDAERRADEDTRPHERDASRHIIAIYFSQLGLPLMLTV